MVNGWQIEAVVLIRFPFADCIVQDEVRSRDILRGDDGGKREQASGDGAYGAVDGRIALHGKGGGFRGGTVAPVVTFETRRRGQGDLVSVAAIQGESVADAEGREVGVSEVGAPTAIVGDELQLDGLSCIRGEVKAVVGPRSPLDTSKRLETRKIVGRGDVIFHTRIKQFVILVKHPDDETGL